MLLAIFYLFLISVLHLKVTCLKPWTCLFSSTVSLLLAQR